MVGVLQPKPVVGRAQNSGDLKVSALHDAESVRAAIGVETNITVEEFREKFDLYVGPLRCSDQEYLKRYFLEWVKGGGEGRTHCIRWSYFHK